MRVLLVSTDFMGIAKSFKTAFCAAGHKCTYLNTSDVKSRFTHLERLCPTAVLMKRSNVVVDAVKRFKPTLVLDLLGANLTSTAVAEIRSTAIIYKYMLDLIDNYPSVYAALPEYTSVFTYEDHDIDRIQRHVSNSVRILYATYDINKFYDLQVEKTIDLSFVGQMFTKEQHKRRLLLEKLVAELPDLNCEFYGIYARPYNLCRFIKWSIKDSGKVFKNQVLGSAEVNALYNRSKICLNINSFQTYDTWSSRLLEMLGTGSFVITERTAKVEEFFGNGLVTYNGYDDLKTLIIKYIDNKDERERVASIGAELAREYTIDRTVKEICDICLGQLESR